MSYFIVLCNILLYFLMLNLATYNFWKCNTKYIEYEIQKIQQLSEQFSIIVSKDDQKVLVICVSPYNESRLWRIVILTSLYPTVLFAERSASTRICFSKLKEPTHRINERTKRFTARIFLYAFLLVPTDRTEQGEVS